MKKLLIIFFTLFTNWALTQHLDHIQLSNTFNASKRIEDGYKIEVTSLTKVAPIYNCSLRFTQGF